MSRTHVILGDGAAGMAAAQTIRTHAPEDRIVIVSDDPQPYYYRAALTNHLLGEVREDELWALPPETWGALKIERWRDTATGVEPKERLVVLRGRGSLRYDTLLLATGARARRLRTPTEDPRSGVSGADLPGVQVFRTLKDTADLKERGARARRVAVIGGGILGIEIAQGLHARGIHVDLVHRGPWLLERVIDRAAADLVRGRIERDGVAVHVNAAIAAIEGSSKGVSAVRLKDRSALAADLVVVAIGIEPNTDFVDPAKLPLRRGFVAVDRRMRVEGLEDVYAAGDVADFEDKALPFRNPTGLWQPAVRQGRIAGRNMARTDRDPPVEYRPGAIYNATTAWDLDLGTIGESADAESRAVLHRDHKGDLPVYKKAILRDGRLVGVLLLGDRHEGPALRRLMSLRGAATDISAVADRLFEPDFDLFGWVAAQERAPGVGRWSFVPWDVAGPLPRDAPIGFTTQRRLAGPVSGETSKFTSKPPPPLHLSWEAGSAWFEDGRVRIGAKRGLEVVLPDPGLGKHEWVVAREGMVWTLRPPAGPAPPCARNGKLLAGATFLSDGDNLQLGSTKLIVGLKRGAGAEPAAPTREAFLLGPLERHGLGRNCTTIGAAADNHVVLDLPGVAPHHAQVLRRGTPPSWFVVDAGSDGQIAVNGEPLAGHRRLFPRDAVRLGERATLTYEEADVNAVAGPGDATKPLPAPAGMIYLVGCRGPLCGKALAVPTGGTIGRGSVATVRIDDPLLSRVHARLERKGDSAAVTDLGSLNGVAVSGKRLEAAAPVTVRAGDEVRLGRNVFRVCLDPPQIDSPAVPEVADGATRRLDAYEHRITEQGPGEPEVSVLIENEITIGRHGENDIVVVGTQVSRRHARLVRGPDGYAIVDRGSTYGTRVNGEQLAAKVPRTLRDGDAIRIGTRTLTYQRKRSELRMPTEAAAPPERTARFVALDAEQAALMRSPVLAGAGPWLVGRRSEECAVHVPFPTVGRVHAEVRCADERFEIQNRSRAGTSVNGNVIAPDAWAPLADGDLVTLQDVRLRFEVRAPARPAAPGPRLPAGVFLSEEPSAVNPLEADLERVKNDEVDACIGCHECMRACPLPDATTVTIAALNACASGVVPLAGTVARFVHDCTQCHACVPVCPADIRRSRIVLWNKLKAPIDEGARLPLQVGAERAVSQLGVGDAADHLLRHEVFGKLPRQEALRLASAARCRLLQNREVLVQEGAYPDALWLVLEGTIEVGIGTEKTSFLPMVSHGAGQTFGEAAVLADQPAEATARALGRALLLGLPKYSLAGAQERNAGFREALAGLYLARSLDAALARLPLPKGAGPDLAAELLPRRYVAGSTVLAAEDAANTFGIVHRGFVREVRRRGPRRRIANYLKVGDVFGGVDAADPEDALLGYEAATKAEVFTVPRERVLDLDRRHPGVLAVLLPAAHTSAGRAADATGTFSCPGGTGILQARQLLVIDTRLCVDCDNCVDACERRHGTPRLDRQNAGLQQGPYQVPASCYHCDDPVCLFCSVNGIVREPSGEIRIIEDNCIGCGACAERCPYDNIFMQPRGRRSVPILQRLLAKPVRRLLGIEKGRPELPDPERVAVKCDLCVGHADGPACVRSCPTGAARRSEPQSLFGVGRGD